MSDINCAICGDVIGRASVTDATRRYVCAIHPYDEINKHFSHEENALSLEERLTRLESAADEAAEAAIDINKRLDTLETGLEKRAEDL